MLIDMALAAAVAITPTHAGDVRLGDTFAALHQAGRIGGLRHGCELSGPNTRFATLRPPLKGTVDFTKTSPRKVNRISITDAGAKARGVGVGSTLRRALQKFPRATQDHRTEPLFGITLVKVPKSGGGRIQFAVSTRTGKVTIIGVPNIAFCE
jgi:hypothetical protein